MPTIIRVQSDRAVALRCAQTAEEGDGEGEGEGVCANASRARRRSLFSLGDVLRAPLLSACALRRWDYPIFVAEKELGERLLSKVRTALCLHSLTHSHVLEPRVSSSLHAFDPPSDARCHMGTTRARVCAPPEALSTTRTLPTVFSSPSHFPHSVFINFVLFVGLSPAGISMGVGVTSLLRRLLITTD